jgi:hypothetical protein
MNENENENGMCRDLSDAVIIAAERYVRELAGLGDLSSPRVRRRLRIAVEALSRIRQVFAADESAELPELDFNVNDRDQQPEPLETANQRMIRELVSMIPMILERFAAPPSAFPHGAFPRPPDAMAGAPLGGTVGSEIVDPESEDAP